MSWQQCIYIISHVFVGIQMLTLIVPVLINFLVEPGIPLGGVGPYRKLLHDVSLQKLMKIGLQYREVILHF